MCGLARSSSRSIVSARPRASHDAIDTCLAHRGPDDRDRHYSADGTALLVHRRLSIIDLTAGGRQPMSSRDGRHWLVYNGEIYNHAALRCAARRAGRHVPDGERHRSPPRMASALWRRRPRFGARACLRWPLWDERERALVLARDRFGMKPLYVHWFPDRVAFASEIGVAGSQRPRRTPHRSGRRALPISIGAPSRRRSRGCAMWRPSRPAPGAGGPPAAV